MAETKQLHVRIPGDMYNALTMLAERDNRPVADVVRKMLARELSLYDLHVASTVQWGGKREPGEGA